MELWFMLAGLVLQGTALLVAGTWRLSQIETKLSALVAKTKDQSTGQVDTLRRETGESLAAIRTKVGELELWVRDNLVHKKSLEMIIEEHKSGRDRDNMALDKRLDRIEDKIDRWGTPPGGSGQMVKSG